jgi:hypothetical protein
MLSIVRDLGIDLVGLAGLGEYFKHSLCAALSALPT